LNLLGLSLISWIESGSIAPGSVKKRDRMMCNPGLTKKKRVGMMVAGLTAFDVPVRPVHGRSIDGAELCKGHAVGLGKGFVF
jgi:hypothetical protein